MSQQTVNNGDTGLNARNKINGNFTELYGAIVQPLKLPGVSANTTQAINANTFIQSISLSATSGTPTIRIGTTANGTDVMLDTKPGSFTQTTIQRYFSAAATLYITVTGGTVNIRIDLLNGFY
jgi:hypothetical protein